MENFLGKQFVQDEKLKLLPSRMISRGLIKADWVNGSFYVKKALDSVFGDTKAWRTLPFSRLIFQNGVLVSEEELVTYPMTEAERKVFKKKMKRFNKKVGKYYKNMIESK